MAEFAVLSAVTFLHLKEQNKQTSALENNMKKKKSQHNALAEQNQSHSGNNPNH